jgi:hypothetical protein
MTGNPPASIGGLTEPFAGRNRDPLAERVDDAGDIVPGDRRQPFTAVGGAIRLFPGQLGRGKSGRVHGDAHFARLRLGLGRVLENDLTGAPALVQANCFHGDLLVCFGDHGPDPPEGRISSTNH